MTALGLIVGLLTMLAAGMGLTALLVRDVPRFGLFEHLALGWLFGTGLVSLLLWMAGFVLSGLTLQLSVTLAAVMVAVGGFTSVRKHGFRLAFPKPQNGLEWMLAGIIALEIAAMIYAAFGHGLGWDGLLNWEIKARYAFLNNGAIPATYYHSSSQAFSHPTYPLLIPMTELWLYLWMGETQQSFIKLIFPFYYAAGAILLAISTSRLTNRRWLGLLVGALFFFVPFLTNSPGDATGGYVDFPLSVYYFTAIAYLLSYAVNREPTTLRIFAISLALLPWTKSEGSILWFVAAILGAIIIWRAEHSRRPLLWLVPGIVIIGAWKIFLHLMGTAEARDFVPMTLTTLGANLGRMLPIMKMVGTEMLELSRWSIFWPCVAFALVSLALRARDQRLFLLGSAVAAPVALYAATYLFSNWPDYTAHFAQSFPRLLLQVMPVAWLAIALAIPRPSVVAPPADTSRQSRSR